MAFRGYLERLRYSLGTGWIVDGWAMDESAPDGPLRVAVLHGPRIIGEVAPVTPRGDLPVGGRCFALPIPPDCPVDDGVLTLTLRIQSRDDVLDIDAQLYADPIIGWVDQQRGAVLSGWACNVFEPDKPVSLDILLDGLCIDQIEVAGDRWDLIPYGLGHCGFEWAMPQQMIDGREHTLTVRVTNGLTQIPGGIAAVSARWESLNAEARVWYAERAAIDDRAAEIRAQLNPPCGAAGLAAPTEDLSQIPVTPRDLQILFGAMPPYAPLAEGIKGRMSGLQDGFIRGRISACSGAMPPTLDICVDDIAVGRIRAEDRIDDDGCYPFAWPAPRAWADGRARRVHVRLTNTSADLPGAIDRVLITATDPLARARLREAQNLHDLMRNARVIGQVIAHEGKLPRQSERLTAVDVLLDRLA